MQCNAMQWNAIRFVSLCFVSLALPWFPKCQSMQSRPALMYPSNLCCILDAIDCVLNRLRECQMPRQAAAECESEAQEEEDDDDDDDDDVQVESRRWSRPYEPRKGKVRCECVCFDRMYTYIIYSMFPWRIGLCEPCQRPLPLLPVSSTLLSLRTAVRGRM